MVLVNTASREWLVWAETVLSERFSLPLRLINHSTFIELRLEGAEHSIKFGSINPCFYTAVSDMPCTQWSPASEDFSAQHDMLFLPGVQKLGHKLVEFSSDGCSFNYDLVGLLSWMLLRVEEIATRETDKFDRFPMECSQAFISGYLDRPVVDELLDILAQVIQRCWPELSLEKKNFSIKVSHDVDRANMIGPSFFKIDAMINGSRAILIDLVKQQNLSAMKKIPACFNIGHLGADHFNNFDWIMDVSERYGLQSAFHFICGRTSVTRDASYDIRHPDMRSLLKSIAIRGHDICLHPSFNSYLDPSQIQNEATLLRTVLTEEDIEQADMGSRMHYLRWRHPDTLLALDAAGMQYDGTLGYSEQPGFRCGTCHEYPAYDPVSDKRLNIRIRPLIAMETSVLPSRQLNKEQYEDSFIKFSELISTCRKVGGQFTLLWHNCEFFSKQRRELYESIVSQ